MASRMRVSTRPTSRPTISMEAMVPTPRGPMTMPGGDDRIVHELLQIRRLQRHRGVIGEADDGDEQHAGREIAVAEQRRPHERLFGREGVDQEQIERRGGDDRLDDDLAGTEPVLLLAAVEHDLQRAEREAQSAEAEPIELRIGVARGLRQERR